MPNTTGLVKQTMKHSYFTVIKSDGAILRLFTHGVLLNKMKHGTKIPSHNLFLDVFTSHYIH